MTASGQTRIYKEQHGGANTTMMVASGGTVRLEAGGHIDASAGQITLPGSLGFGYIDLSPYLLNARELASAETLASGTTAPTYFFQGVLGADTTPALSLTASGDQSFYLNWASANVDGIKLPPIMLPGDMSTAGGLSVGLFGESVGSGTASDAKSAFDIRAWAGVGDTEMGATHPDFTTTPALQSISIASGDLTTTILNLTLVPEAHAGRPIRLYGGRIRYTKKTS